TFAESSERLRRAGRKMLPECFYRVFFENSATLSPFVSVDTHSKHRARPNLKIRPENGFQAIGDFNARLDLTKERIERHLWWNRKLNPSSYISAFNKLSEYLFRIARIGERISVAKIDTEGLFAATVQSTLEETVSVYEKGKIVPESTTKTTRQVLIPVFIRNTAVPDDLSPLDIDNFDPSKGDMWLSITELRHFDLKIGLGEGHDYEFIACGIVPKSRVTKIMPYDGYDLHYEPPNHTVWSRTNTRSWFFRYQDQMW
ncbi:hypothetical protein K491DRAFT_555675, partial [Lophiostoma macrostomum CBS 122681]